MIRLLKYCCRIWERDRRTHPELRDLLRVGVEWSTIEAATGLGPEAFRALKRQLEEAESGTAAG